MNIINTMCRISDLTIQQKVSLVSHMPDSKYWKWDLCELFIGFTPMGNAGTWRGTTNATIVTYTEMMQLLGKTMKEFTKSDLKTGMVVRNRNGNYKIVFGNSMSGLDNTASFSSFTSNLLGKQSQAEFDIMAVYKVGGAMLIRATLSGEGLTLIWERTEQTPAQKEMEVLQAKMDELQEQMKVVQAKL
jgi:hypothetical protein